jgi:DNA-binding NtrC family response regulator
MASAMKDSETDRDPATRDGDDQSPVSAPRTRHALALDDDPHSLRFLSEFLKEEGFEVSLARTVAEAQKILETREVDTLLLDLMLPDGSGLDVLTKLATRSRAQVIMLTAHSSVETIADALRLGACDYITKPIEIGRLKTVLANVIRTFDLSDEILALREQLKELGQFGRLVGASPGMQQVYDRISKVGPSEASVLIQGESGTGKDLVAQAVHEFSHRRRGAYVPINCGAISPNLIESELFGHEKGSFTGADKMRRGVFERASGGTLFLDEITEMPIELQVKLLRVLEAENAVRVGGDQPVAVDVRVLAATNRSPEEAVAAGKLRADLLYRLNVFPIVLPPLRDRGEDVTLLAGTFLGQLNKQHGTAKKLTQASIDHLRKHSWPGNVRELKNTIHRAFIVSGDEIVPENLFEDAPCAIPASGNRLTLDLGITMSEAERRLIDATFQFCNRDKKKTAETLGISLRTLYYRMNGKSET